MKIYNYLTGLALLSILFLFSSCNDDYDAPPLTEPKVEDGLEANITIAELKSKYAKISDPTIIDTEYVLRAYVIGNDVSGNIYKQLYIQDKSGGINIGIDQNSIYTEFRVGQEVFLKLKGLSMVKYGHHLQIGYKDTNANRIPWEIFKFYVHKNAWANTENVVPNAISLGEIENNMVNTLVRFDNVYFVEGGKASFSKPDATTNRELKDASGKKIIVRNSNYAKFSADILPLGTGSVTGVLSKFRDTWQLLLRSKEDIGTFDGVEPKESGNPTDVGIDPNTGNGGNEGNSETILSEKFSTSLGSFTQFSVTGDYSWRWSSFKSKETGEVLDTYTKISGYNGATKTTEANEDWLISPSMDLSSVKSASISFEHAINYANDMTTEQTLWISNDYNTGNPKSATWKQITITTYPTGKDWKFVAVSGIAIPSDYIGKTNVRFAFKYVCNTEKAGTWEVKNVVVK